MRRLFLALPLALFALGAWHPRALAQAEPEVRVHILVIEASTKDAGFDPVLQKDHAGALKALPRSFVGAKLIDEVEASVAPDAQVSLQIKGKGQDKRTLEVRVLEAKDEVVKLHVAIAEAKFKTVTTHHKGGTFAVAYEKSGDTTVLLMVTPKTKR